MTPDTDGGQSASDTDRGDVVITPHGSAAHVEVGGKLLCYTNSRTNTETFDDDKHEWPENGLCPECKRRGGLVGIVHRPSSGTNHSVDLGIGMEGPTQ